MRQFLDTLFKAREGMTNKKIIKAVNRWQNEDRLHPLTCERSKHRKLVAVEKDGNVILKCLDCDYEQDWIPTVVLDYKPSN